MAKTLRGVTLACGVWAATVLFAGTAFAHALLVSSSPTPGQRLGATPGLVTLRYSETLNPRLSQATVTDPTGHRFRGSVSGAVLTVPLATNAPGLYRASWTSVSLDDGHTERGTFDFSVVSQGSLAGSGPNTEAPTALDYVVAGLRTVEYTALLFAIGALLVRRLARRTPALHWANPAVELGLGVALLAAFTVAAGDALDAASGRGLSQAADYLATGLPGLSRMAVIVCLSFAGLAVVRRLPITPAVVAATVALAASGHPAAASPAWLMIGVDALHLLAAGLWAGGIMALATVRAPDGWFGGPARALLDRFTPAALAAFALTALLGVLEALRYVGAPTHLLASAYGRVLTVKILGVAAMLPLSYLAWRRHIAPRAEAAIAVFVVGAAALLGTYPLPVPPAAAALAHPGPSPVARSAWPRAGDLTLGGHAGQVVVGLTLQPGTPGPNTILLYLEPLIGRPTRVRAELSVNGDPVPLVPCGSTCREAQTTLEGGEHIEVAVAGAKAAPAQFTVPPLPAPDGARLFSEAQRRMHALRTLRFAEVLNSGLAVVRSLYASEAPDRMEIQTGTSDTLYIGTTRYTRGTPTDGWHVETGGLKNPQPSFIWDFFKPYTQPRVLGTRRLDGRRATIVSFFGRTGDLGVWFRLWIDRGGYVQRSEMRTLGHFMDEDYFAFNGPLSLSPPVSPAGTGSP